MDKPRYTRSGVKCRRDYLDSSNDDDGVVDKLKARGVVMVAPKIRCVVWLIFLSVDDLPCPKGGVRILKAAATHA